MRNKVPANEQLFADSVRCQPNVMTAQPAGDKGKNVSSTRAAVTVSCRGTSYDKDMLQKQMEQRLRTKAANDPGNGCLLVSMIKTNVQMNMATLHVDSSGIWVYQFDERQPHNLANMIVGNDVATALNILKRQTGIQYAFIHVESGVVMCYLLILLRFRPGLVYYGAIKVLYA